MTAEFAHPLVLAGKTQQNFLKVSLLADPLPDNRYPPLNICVLLDRSESMQQNKLEAARQTIGHFAGQLSSEDAFSLVTYDDTVRVLLPATRLTERVVVERQLEGLRANGTAALFAGICKGTDELRKFLDPARVNRLLVLSGGRAAVGPQSPREFSDLGSVLAKEGISVSTFGLGLGYGEDAIAGLSSKSDGNHHFVAELTDLQQYMQFELNELRAAVVQDLELEFDCLGGTRPLRVLGREAQIDVTTAVSRLHRLQAQQEKYELLQLELPAGQDGQTIAVVRVVAQFFDLRTNRRERLQQIVKVRYTGRVEDVQEKTSQTVMASCVLQIANLRNDEALQLRDRGRIEEARQLLLENYAFCSSNAVRYNAPALIELGNMNFLQSEQLSDSNWNATRKMMRVQQNIQSQRRSIQVQETIPPLNRYLQLARAYERQNVRPSGGDSEKAYEELQRMQQLEPLFDYEGQEVQQRKQQEDSRSPVRRMPPSKDQAPALLGRSPEQMKQQR